jgi:CubicO group peptidase (beta-lactamase class C family)
MSRKTLCAMPALGLLLPGLLLWPQVRAEQPNVKASRIPSQRPAAPSGIVGLWTALEEYGPAIRGDILVDGRGRTWRARVAGVWVDVTRSENDVRFEIPGNGDFRGVLGDDNLTIRGHWRQPGFLLNRHQFATPVELVASGGPLWRGTLATLDTSLRFYLHVRANTDGSVTAVIRNPEQNRHGNRLFDVKCVGSAVTLTSIQSHAWSSKTVQIAGRFDSARDSLFLRIWGRDGFELEFKRATTSTGFTARDSVGTPYTYRPPELLDDSWQTGSLHDVGLARAPIIALVRSILDSDPDDLDNQKIHALLIARRGKLVVEEYFYGFHREQAHDVRSAFKTFAPMLVGVARDHGVKIDATTRVYDLYAAKYAPFANWDERKRAITVEHFMTGRSGLACDDNDPNSPGEETRVVESADWYKYTLDLPLVRSPGGATGVYSTASLNMVGGIVEQASGIWNGDLFERYIARPLQFGRYYLNLTPTGQAHTGGMAYLRPRDSLKLGQLYLNGGAWNGRRVISRDWVDRSIQSHGRFGDDPEPLAAYHEYGYGWHIFNLKAGGKTYRSYQATGNGGQLVIVVPDAELVVAVNAGNYSARWFPWGQEMMSRHVLAAVR